MFPVKFNDADYKDTIQKSSKMVARSARSGRNLLLDFLVYNAVLAVCTFVGMLFRSLGFSDATIISVYILGVLVSAVLITNYISNFVVSFEAMIVFNFFFTGGISRHFRCHADRLLYFLYDRSEAQGDRQEI